ncbi:uncharacterized protein LOC113233362 [Hyposmocoma kahamanoa]|uniref:uncharacterized protein LOC113233362 n=1 Tax=Hyposmocoma kahamanoa TaxID=1477025 RepID=UPI000E6D94B1|nr:uncharacterized protein LOC113233362 [Hyposmocoma kahamanoa]
MFCSVHITYLIIALVFISDQLVSSAKCKKCKTTIVRKTSKVSKPINNKAPSRFLTTMRAVTNDNKVSTIVTFNKRILSRLQDYSPDITDMYNRVGKMVTKFFYYIAERRKLLGVDTYS